MQNVASFYDQNVEREWTRLDRHPVEFALTKRYLDRYITQRSRILDVGGGPGKYAFYLKAQGHQVNLLDLSAANINYAKTKAKELQLELDDYRQANALDLGFIPDECFDVVLALGPLYHLTETQNQIRAIDECLRVLKPNGLIFVAFITRFAQLITLIDRTPEKIGEWRAYFEAVIATGLNRGDVDSGFTDAYFFDPKEIADFMNRFPTRKIALAGTDGLFAQSESKLLGLDPATLATWIDFADRLAEHPSLLGASQHALYIGVKK